MTSRLDLVGGIGDLGGLPLPGSALVRASRLDSVQ
jgi:hypothetical protein